MAPIKHDMAKYLVVIVVIESKHGCNISINLATNVSWFSDGIISVVVVMFVEIYMDDIKYFFAIQDKS